MLADEGQNHREIARALNMSPDIARLFLQLFAIACKKPEDYGRPISHWTARDLADEAIKQGIVTTISPRHVGRLMAEADLKPHQFQYWLSLPRPAV